MFILLYIDYTLTKKRRKKKSEERNVPDDEGSSQGHSLLCLRFSPRQPVLQLRCKSSKSTSTSDAWLPRFETQLHCSLAVSPGQLT